MNKLTILSNCFLLFCFSALAQEQQVAGKIVSANGKPVVQAAVILSYQHQQRPQSVFAISDSLGRFSLAVPVTADSLVISISALGHTEYKQPVSNKAIDKPITITLKSTAKLLPEVSVKAAPKVVVRGDTTSFNADAYSRKNETNVEDLVKKLPGFDVDNDGNMRYNGKPIERVLLDGDDLYGRDFKLLTKNLSADAVETVQTIDNYSSNKLLSDLGKSGKQVLNLKLRKRKTTLNGNITLGGGLPDNRYENRLNLLSFSKKLKVVGLGSMNNTGVSPFSFVTVDRPNYLQRSLDDETEGMRSNPLTTVPELNLRGISARRSNLNQSAIGTVNFLSRPSDKLMIKGQLYFINDNNNQIQLNDITYLNNLQGLKVLEQTRLQKKQFFQGYRLEMAADLTSRSQLLYKGRIDENNRRNDVALALSGLNLHPELHTIGSNQEHRIQYINRLNNNLALDAQLLHSRSNTPQRLLLDSIPYPQTLALTHDPEATLLQRTDLPLRQTNLTLRLPGRLKKDNFLITANANIINRDFDNTVQQQRKNGTIQEAGNDFGGFFATSERNVSIEGTYTKRIVNWDITAGASWNYLRFRFNEQESNSNLQNQSFSYPAYRISFARKISEVSRLNIEYSFKYKLPLFLDLIPRNWFSTYRATDKGSPIYQRLPERALSLNYSLIDYYKKQVLWYIGIAYRNNPANYIPSLGFTPILESNTRQAFAIDNHGYLAYQRLEKYISPFKGNILLDLNSYWGAFQNILSGQLSESQFNNTTARLSFKSVWKGIFNITASAGLRLNAQKVTQAGKTRKDENRFIENQVNLFFTLPKQRFSLEIDANHYSIPNNVGRQDVYFVDFNAQYIVKKDKLIMSLIGNNINGNTALTFENISPMSIATQRFQLLPRFVLLKLYYKF
jgi:hypothetical protein